MVGGEASLSSLPPCEHKGKGGDRIVSVGGGPSDDPAPGELRPFQRRIVAEGTPKNRTMIEILGSFS